MSVVDGALAHPYWICAMAKSGNFLLWTIDVGRKKGTIAHAQMIHEDTDTHRRCISDKVQWQQQYTVAGSPNTAATNHLVLITSFAAPQYYMYQRRIPGVDRPLAQHSWISTMA